MPIASAEKQAAKDTESDRAGQEVVRTQQPFFTVSRKINNLRRDGKVLTTSPSLVYRMAPAYSAPARKERCIHVNHALAGAVPVKRFSRESFMRRAHRALLDRLL